jgi:hypothetical protein
MQRELFGERLGNLYQKDMSDSSWIVLQTFGQGKPYYQMG